LDLDFIQKKSFNFDEAIGLKEAVKTAPFS